MNLHVLPSAVTRMAGPQIMSAIILVTHGRAVRVSLAYLGGHRGRRDRGGALTRRVAASLSGAGALSLGDPADA
ncbi:hypothetical protein [Thermostaphylospora chromogena]|uniref:Uncharacterized protein n=1 Tax=Thermostaphylospora chromogena TaxID=35622 RepID=A0A1H1FLX3_9ACTN|nr:hypothetical protein [Thermostaphylospora chromogena]SDR01897.1 hypothetical protein SAMN04489764_3055 [Thermostaphylospora chromogena]